MANSPTISSAPLEYPGMDYAFLRQEGINWIAKLAGSQWTDYNTHDPGIAILEVLCYALTDLSYRLSFAIEDLLAYPPDTPDPPSLFLTAREVLTVNPLTIADYRKLLIDIDGINNAWLEPVETPQPALYYDENNARLTFSSENLATPVPLRGLYRVLLEPHPNYRQDDQKRDLAAAAATRLHHHRNLCEDFAEIRVLEFEEITVKAAIEIGENVDPQQLFPRLHGALGHHISPPVLFSSLPALLERGKPVEEIFDGPTLHHGFIDDADLLERTTELHTSDLIRILLDMPDVKTVRWLTLSGNLASAQQWALDLDPQLTPRLKSLQGAIAAGDIQLYKGQIPCSLDPQRLSNPTNAPQRSPTSMPTQDLAIPTGEYRQLATYETIQNEFPLAYGIGEIGLPASVSAERKAQSKQLQAYLMAFDQLLANYFAQLDRLKDLFSLSHTQIQTYFFQSIEHFPGARDILQASYREHLENLLESDAVARDRKNRFLDHLLARYGETFTDYSLLYPDATLSNEFLKRKADFARDYRQIGAGGDRAFNYTLDPDKLENRQDVSGLKRRLARLWGMEPAREFLSSSENEEGFYIVEHLLLRPREAPSTSDSEAGETATSQVYLSYAQAIDSFTPSETTNYVTCTSVGHGLQTGDRITIFYSSHYNGTYEIANPDSDTFDILHEFVEGTDTGQWVDSLQQADPFSFQVSAIFPNWPGRLASDSFRQLIYDSAIAETPAHITLYIHWFDRQQMREFESIYMQWLQYLSGNVANREEADLSSMRLINFLGLGSSTIPEFPALLGYMVIQGPGEEIDNPFTVS